MRLYYGGQFVLIVPLLLVVPLPADVPTPQVDDPSAVLIVPPALLLIMPLFDVVPPP